VSTNGLSSSDVSTNHLEVTAPPAPVGGTVNQAIRPSADGAVADFGPHKVSFAINANTEDAIQIQLPQPFASQNPVVLRSHVVGLCYWAASGTSAGQSVMIASLTDSTGQIVPPASVCYPDALGTGFDVVYNYSQSSIEQDVVIKAQLPAPDSVLPAGTDERDVMLGVATEFLDPPEPRHSPVAVGLRAANQALGVQGPDSMMAEDLLFGPMRILGAGRAFLLGSSGGPTVPTATAWVTQPGSDGQGGHCYVVDSVPYLLVKAQLAALPGGQGKGHGRFKPAKDLKTMLASAPRPSPASSPAPRPMTLAKAGARPVAGLVLDYIFAANYLLNINFGGRTGEKAGPAAVGQSSSDYWNGFYYYPNQYSVTVNNLLWANSNASGVSLTSVGGPGDWANGASDPMLNTYMYAYGQSILITLSNLPAATYDFYLYGHGPTTDNSVFQLSCGLASWGPLSNAVSGWDVLPNWTNGDEYVVFTNVAVASGQSVVTSVLPDDINYSLICGLQANMTVAIPPAIVQQPASQTVAQGGTANFQVGATGTTPFSYQWSFNGAGISGATASTYTINNVQTSQAGLYAVTVSNIAGSVVSSNATLTVNTGPACVNPPSGQVGWWQAEGSANDFYNVSNGSTQGNTTYAPGEVGQAFILNNPDAQPGGTANVMVPGSALNVGAGGGLTVEAWIYPWDVYYQHPVVEWNDGSFGVHLWLSTPLGNGGPGSLFGDIKDVNLSDHWLSSAQGVVGINAWQHVALTYDKATCMACLYHNGTTVAQLNVGSVTPLTATNLYFGLRPYDAGAGYRFAGGIDEVGVYSRALAASEILSIYNAGSFGKCTGGAPPPVLTGLINLDFGGAASSPKTGLAAVGESTSDFWNYLGPLVPGPLANLKNADRTVSPVGVTMANVNSASTDGCTSDPMYNAYVFGPQGQSGTLTFTNLPAGNYTVLAYSYDGNFSLSAGGTGYGTVTTEYNIPPVNPAPWVPWLHYAFWDSVALSTGQSLVLTVQPGPHNGYAAICGLQIAGLDPDGSGLPVCWEMEYFGQRGVAPNGDPDGDGLSSWQEYLWGTNPGLAEGFTIWVGSPGSSCGIP
jgi:hypothetical protein